MSILSEFFVASPNEITVDSLRNGPASIYPTVSSTSLTTLEMQLLSHVLQGDGRDDVSEPLSEFADVIDWGSEGPWLSKLPDALRDALAVASEKEAVEYASRWLEAEELAGADHATLTSLLLQLQHLARTAQSEGKALYLWFSL